LALSRRRRGDRFQCLLRPVPAAEWAAVGWILRSQGSLGHLFCGGGVLGLAPGACGRWGLRGIGPALAGNVGAG
jgi:hypothetical protein